MSKMTKTTRMTTTVLGVTLAAALVLLSLGAARAETTPGTAPQPADHELGTLTAPGFIDDTGALCYVIDAPDGANLQVICGAGADTVVV